MEWCTIDEKYMNYLRTFEDRIPRSDYGKESFKPFFAPLFEKNGLVYVTQISSAKIRHKSLKESADFKKIYDNRNQLIGVINLNYMFPVPKDEIKYLDDYSNISNFRNFSSPKEESQYINFLKIELTEINNKNIGRDAGNVYALKIQQPEHPISKRCIDFKLLEEKALEYVKEKQIDPWEKQLKGFKNKEKEIDLK